MQVKGKKRSNHNTSIYRGSATRTFFFLSLRPRPEYLTWEFLSLVNKLLSPAEKTLHVAYTITDTKLDVEFFYKGTTTPVSSFTRVQQLPTHFVFWGLKY